MNRIALALSLPFLSFLLLERDARACGGCFHPVAQIASDITDERMLLSVSPTQTTLYDQIRYAGSPSSFAWVLPIHGAVTVGLSADILFAAVDALTATEVNQPASTCPQPTDCGGGGGCGFGLPSSSDGSESPHNGGAAIGPAVTINKHENVGPYETVQLHATDSSALNDWLASNAFEIPPDATAILDAYVREGFDFLAMKLQPNQGVQAMRPVRVTSMGASVSLPLRMASIGTGATVGITIWVFADGRYEPQNYPFFHVEDSDLVWNWSTGSSNYTDLRSKDEAALGRSGWEIESSIALNQQVIASAIRTGGQIGVTGFGPSSPTPAAQDYLPENGSMALQPSGASDPSPDAGPSSDASAGIGGEGADSGSDARPLASSISLTAEEVREADIGALFSAIAGSNVRATRIRSDIAHSALTVDLVLRASSDQSELSNIRSVSASVNETCAIYSGCSVVGTGTPKQAAASTSKGGCAASPESLVAASTESGAMGGLLGLLLARLLRSRRRPAR